MRNRVKYGIKTTIKSRFGFESIALKKENQNMIFILNKFKKEHDSL